MNKAKAADIEKEMLDGATSIGLKICNQSIWHEEKCNWLGRTIEDISSSPNKNGKMVVFALGPDIYSGTSGISLFFGYLYLFTKNEIFKKHAKGAISQSLSILDEEYINSGNIRYGFYSGFVGIAYAAAQLGKLFNDKELLKKSLEILLNLDRDKKSTKNNRGTDIISGNAGSIPALLDLRLKVLPDKEIIDLAIFLGNELLLLAVKDEKGYSWDSGLVSIGRASHNLLGFSHGAAGIGYSLLELYNQTKNKRFLDGAINAFKYENHWFNKDNDNWPDFRINTYQGDRQGKKKYTYPIKWCHGAPGIGFSRIRAYQILKENMYKSDVDAALRTSVKHIEDNQYYSGYVNNDYSLCHGLSGIADLLLFSDQTFRTNYRDMLLKIYQNANKENNIKKDAGSWRCGIPNGETPDLMVGLAGIGYMYLRLYAPDKVPSILCITADKC